MPLTESQKQTIKWVARVQNSAKANGGIIVSRFSQCTPPISSLIGMYNTTEDGVCQALSNKWIAEHANGGSLWNQVYSGGLLQSGVIANLMLQFIDSVGKGPGRAQQRLFLNQDIHAEKYLYFYGVVRRQDIVNGKRHYFGASTNAPSSVLGQHMAESMCGTAGSRNASGAYQLIYIYGDGGAHAMAAWVDKDVAFFDPNFGEFWFEKASDFRNWFKDFWDASGYSRSFKKYELRSFAKKMGHVTARPTVKRGDRV